MLFVQTEGIKNNKASVKYCNPMRVQDQVRHLKHTFLTYKRNTMSVFRTLSNTSNMERFCKNT